MKLSLIVYRCCCVIFFVKTPPLTPTELIRSNYNCNSNITGFVQVKIYHVLWSHKNVCSPIYLLKVISNVNLHFWGEIVMRIFRNEKFLRKFSWVMFINDLNWWIQVHNLKYIAYISGDKIRSHTYGVGATWNPITFHWIDDLMIWLNQWISNWA